MINPESRHLTSGLADDYERTAHIVEGMASIRSALVIDDAKVQLHASNLASHRGIAEATEVIDVLDQAAVQLPDRTKALRMGLTHAETRKYPRVICARRKAQTAM
jgi:hypothetical protein